MPATLSKRVLLQFRVVAHAVRSAPRRIPPQPVIGDRKLLALHAIAHLPGIGVNGVARSLGVRQPSASQLIKALSALRLVQVQRDERDRRAVRLHASADGLAVLRGLPADFDFGDRLPEALDRLDARSLSRLESGLADLLQALPGTDHAGVAEAVDDGRPAALGR